MIVRGMHWAPTPSAAEERDMRVLLTTTVATGQRLEGERTYNYFMSLLGSDHGAPETGGGEQ